MTRKSFFVKIGTLLISFLFIGLFFSGNSAYAKTFSNVEIGDFTYDLDEDTQIATVTKYSPGWWSRHFGEAYKSDSVVIPELVEYKKKNYSVKKIGDSFSTSTTYMRDLKKKKVSGKSIEIIGNHAFERDYYMDYLEDIYFPNVTVIGVLAFSGCNNLTNVDFPKVTKIGYGAFFGCENLTSINIPVVTEIGIGAFMSCHNLTNIDFSTVTQIGYSAFLGCSNLTNISLPNVTKIDSFTFANCNSLANVNLPNATEIGYSAFRNCENLTDINIPKVEHIGGWAFENCKNLKFIETPSLKSCDYIFPNLPQEITFKVPASMRNYGLENLTGADNVNIVYTGLGKKVTINGVVNYVDEDGKTSAAINDYKIIWLKETSDGTSAWYGIDNSKGTFKIGSTFWVKWLHPDINKEEFDIYYNQLDDEKKKKVEDNKLWIFLTGVTDPDGNEYTNLDRTVEYYIQIGEDWDKKDIKVFFISKNTDEDLGAYYENLSCPEGTYEFAVLKMKHFSPYAAFDETNDVVAFNQSTDNVVAAKKSTESASVITGENLQILNLMFMLYASWLAFAYLNRKSRI